VGEYLEVVDYDPASKCFYSPVNLNDLYLLAQEGMVPSEGNPHFHQQMAYAVAMTTIHNFERALGRRALWSPHIVRDQATGEFVSSEPVSRLRVYPHALREANAYYSPEKKALLLGYFPAILSNPGENLPGGFVFTCLSHDVVAHETTHALLDGLHRYFAEPSNADVLAFHEAFADLVALFQHFTQPEALRHQIAKTRGDLASQNLLGELAHQFGQAIGNRGALRDAIGHVDSETGKWEPQVPDPEAYPTTLEPHARGAILVATLFDAFLSIYKARIADLLRIATGGSGVRRAGSLHPDLVNRMAVEATMTADHFLGMIIRALDYCPPVDITFGDYLRALITADWDIAPTDELGYRIAVIEAFRRRGIYPTEVRTLAADGLRLQRPPAFSLNFAELIKSLKQDLSTLEWQTTGPRDQIDRLNKKYQEITHDWIVKKLVDPETGRERDPKVARSLGLSPGDDAWNTIYRSSKKGGLPALEVHSVRSARRPLQDGRTIVDLVVEMTQRRRGYLDPEKQKQAEKLLTDSSKQFDEGIKPDFTVRGGCTLLINSETGELRYCIAKSIRSDARLARQRDFVQGLSAPSLRATYTAAAASVGSREPFALLHRCH